MSGSREAEDRWLAVYGLRRTKGHPCLQRVLGRRCTSPYGVSDRCDGCGHPYPWWDHVRLYRDADGNYLLLAQPYPLGADHLRELLDVADRLGLDVEFNGSAWWNDGVSAILFRDETAMSA